MCGPWEPLKGIMQGIRKRVWIPEYWYHFVIGKGEGDFGATEEIGSAAPHTPLAHVASSERQQCGFGHTGRCSPARPQRRHQRCCPYFIAFIASKSISLSHLTAILVVCKDCITLPQCTCLIERSAGGFLFSGFNTTALHAMHQLAAY